MSTRYPNLRVGMNPYGLTYSLGMQGAGTPRANPAGTGLEGFIALGIELGAEVLEIFNPWLTALGASGRHELRSRLADAGITPVISTFLSPSSEPEHAVENAVDLGATTMRLGLSPVLQGDRNAFGAAQWAGKIAEIRAALAAMAPSATDAGVFVGLENHQDFGSAELLAFAEEAGETFGITFDTGNAFPVGESPLSFARAAIDRIHHVHLKDYRVQFTDEGYRLVRCAIGDGAVPFTDIFDLLLADGRSLTAVLEPGALEVRHIRLFTQDWWKDYAPRDARALAETLRAARRNLLPETEDHRTPWERESPGDELIEYEQTMMRKSVANMRELGLLE